jgi:hypothetical protein
MIVPGCVLAIVLLCCTSLRADVSLPLRPTVRAGVRAGDTDSPMQLLVRAAYLEPGMKTLGQYPSKDERPWPSVILEREESAPIRR